MVVVVTDQPSAFSQGIAITEIQQIKLQWIIS